MMKRMLVMSLLLAWGGALVAREGGRVTRDSLESGRDEGIVSRDTLYHPPVAPAVACPPGKRGERRFAGHSNGHWAGLYFGFTKFLDHAWQAYDGDMELDWGRSFTLQLNAGELIVMMNPPNRHLFLSGLGLEYQRLCFNREVTLEKRDGELRVVPLGELGLTDVRRSVFKVLYLTVPLLYEHQSRSNADRYFSVGVVGGVRLHSKTKIVYDARGDKRKVKETGSYNLSPFKLDATARVGLGGATLWASKALTPMFLPGKADRVYPFTIGLAFTR
jgi:hypothetical protein